MRILKPGVLLKLINAWLARGALSLRRLLPQPLLALFVRARRAVHHGAARFLVGRWQLDSVEHLRGKSGDRC